MQLEFVNRTYPLGRLVTLIQAAPPEKSLVLLDSPAGMGKTDLLVKVCRELRQYAHEQGEQESWRFIHLDFGDTARRYKDQGEILEEIAYQICIGDVALDLPASHEGSDAAGTPRDAFSDYEAALCQLKHQLQGHDLYHEALVYEQRLTENITDSRLYGNNDTRKAERSEIIDRLNALAKSTLNCSFNEIFRQISPTSIQELEQRLLSKTDRSLTKQLRAEKGFTDQQKQVAVLVRFILEKKGEANQHLPDNVLLVLDGLDTIDEKTSNWIISKLALGLHDGLQVAFRRFFIIVSGRFIEQDLSFAVKKRYYTDYVLDPFTPDIVEALIHEFHDNQFNEQPRLVSRLARKLCQVCGGHPKVIKDAATKLHSYDRVKHFSALVTDPQGAGYWYDNPLIDIKSTLADLRSDAIDKIVGEISDQQRYLLRLLSPFRKFNVATLETLSSLVKVCDQPLRRLDPYHTCLKGNVDELFDGLVKTRLIWDGGIEPFYSDRIVLSLMAAQMQEQEHDLFCLLNEWAVSIFADWIEGKFHDDPNTLRPLPGAYQRICVCEWLFHRLHTDKRCDAMSDALAVGQEVAQNLTGVLEDIQPFPGESRARQRQRIREYVEQDQQIDHLIWETALEDQGRYAVIREQILDAF